jgi:hypothetical protein
MQLDRQVHFRVTLLCVVTSLIGSYTFSCEVAAATRRTISYIAESLGLNAEVLVIPVRDPVKFRYMEDKFVCSKSRQTVGGLDDTTSGCPDGSLPQRTDIEMSTPVDTGHLHIDMLAKCVYICRSATTLARRDKNAHLDVPRIYPDGSHPCRARF